MALQNNPYPILKNSGGNFKENQSEFNCIIENIEFSEEKYKIKIRASIENEDQLSNLLANGKIKFIVSVESKPFYRKTFVSGEINEVIDIEIDFRELSSQFALQLTPKLITSDYLQYKNENADYPMNEYSFNLAPKQKLAEHDEIIIVFEKEYKLFDSGPLIHICKIDKNPTNGLMDINLDNPYNIIIQVNQKSYEIIKNMNSIDPKILSTTLSVPVMYHTLSSIKDDTDRFRESNWAKLLDEEFGIFDRLGDSNDVLKLCDKILNSSTIKLFEHIIKNN